MRNWISGAAAIVVLFCAREAAAACAGPLSATHYCVTHNGLVYSLDDGSGAVAQKTITVDPDVELSFELDPADNARFMGHPFYITDSSFGAGNGTKYTQPAMSGTVTFTPTTDKTPLYYQCSVHANMGGRIDVVGADAGPPPADAGTDATTPPPSELPDGSASSSSSSGGASSSSSSGASSSSSSGATADAGTGSDAQPSDDGGCNTSGTGASGAGILLAAVSFAALRRRRQR